MRAQKAITKARFEAAGEQEGDGEEAGVWPAEGRKGMRKILFSNFFGKSLDKAARIW
jgi:hypothetical protein